jgi:hypothetical protein
VGEASDAELQDAVFGALPAGADSNRVSTAPSDADLDYAWQGDIYGLSASAGPQDLYTIGQVSNEGPGVLAENQASMNDYWLSAQDNAVAQSNPIKYLGAGLMRSLGNIGYGIAEMGVGLWENPGSGGIGAAKAVANFGPEAFNFGVNTLKTVLDGYTLLAETAGLPEGSLQSFRDSDPFNITPLFSYDSPAESGGALLSGLVSGAAYTKLRQVRSLTNNINYSKAPTELFIQGADAIPGQAIKPKNIYRELRKSDVGRETLQIMKDNNITSVLSNSPPPVQIVDGVPYIVRGRQYGDTVVTYVQATGSKAETAMTQIHEVTHAAGVAGRLTAC